MENLYPTEREGLTHPDWDCLRFSAEFHGMPLIDICGVLQEKYGATIDSFLEDSDIFHLEVTDLGYVNGRRKFGVNGKEYFSLPFFLGSGKKGALIEENPNILWVPYFDRHDPRVLVMTKDDFDQICPQAGIPFHFDNP